MPKCWQLIRKFKKKNCTGQMKHLSKLDFSLGEVSGRPSGGQELPGVAGWGGGGGRGHLQEPEGAGSEEQTQRCSRENVAFCI